MPTVTGPAVLYHRHAVHAPPLWIVVVDGLVLGHAVVPNGHGTGPPAITDMEFRRFHMVEGIAQQTIARACVHAGDQPGKGLIDIEEGPPGNRMARHDRMNRRPRARQCLVESLAPDLVAEEVVAKGGLS